MTALHRQFRITELCHLLGGNAGKREIGGQLVARGVARTRLRGSQQKGLRGDGLGFFLQAAEESE